MITQYTKKFVGYIRNTKAVSALEYAILIGIIATAIAGALMTFGTSIDTTLDNIGDDLKGASRPAVNLKGK